MVCMPSRQFDSLWALGVIQKDNSYYYACTFSVGGPYSAKTLFTCHLDATFELFYIQLHLLFQVIFGIWP